MLQRGGGIEAEPAMDWRGLHHGAARRHQPVEALGDAEAANGTRAGGAVTDKGNEIQVAPHVRSVEAGREGAESRLVKLDARGQKAARATEQDHARVDELLALGTR